MEAIALLFAVVFAYTILKSWLDSRARLHADRIRLIEKALATGSLDKQALQDLAYGLSGRKPPKVREPKSRASILLALGWITMFVGIGIALLGGVAGEDSAIAAGTLVGVIGFGITTYPFALRELQARRGEQ